MSWKSLLNLNWIKISKRTPPHIFFLLSRSFHRWDRDETFFPFFSLLLLFSHDSRTNLHFLYDENYICMCSGLTRTRVSIAFALNLLENHRHLVFLETRKLKGSMTVNKWGRLEVLECFHFPRTSSSFSSLKHFPTSCFLHVSQTYYITKFICRVV